MTELSLLFQGDIMREILIFFKIHYNCMLIYLIKERLWNLRKAIINAVDLILRLFPEKREIKERWHFIFLFS